MDKGYYLDNYIVKYYIDLSGGLFSSLTSGLTMDIHEKVSMFIPQMERRSQKRTNMVLVNCGYPFYIL